jgi:sRNA-binding carbon storage regulator CsrA
MAMSFMDIDVKPGDRILIGGQLVTIELLQKSGQLARLRVGAPPQVPIKKEPHEDGHLVTRMAA